MVFLQPVGQRYPLQAVRTPEQGTEENYILQREPTREHEAFSGTNRLLCAMAILREAPEKSGVSSRRENLTNEMNLESK